MKKIITAIIILALAKSVCSQEDFLYSTAKEIRKKLDNNSISYKDWTTSRERHAITVESDNEIIHMIISRDSICDTLIVIPKTNEFMVRLLRASGRYLNVEYSEYITAFQKSTLIDI